MGRAPCCDKANVKKGPWSPEEDAKLKSYIDKYGTGGNWIALPQKIGLKRCGKSCRLRWLNYLRPNIKHGGFTDEEDYTILSLYISIGSRWSIIAAQLPGRTDNDIKNYWNTRLKKKLLGRRKQQQGGGGGVNGVKEEEAPSLSSSALERLQLHMQLQNNGQQENSFSFFNNPTLWPKLHPLIQEKLLQNNLQSLNNHIPPHHQQQSYNNITPVDFLRQGSCSTTPSIHIQTSHLYNPVDINNHVDNGINKNNNNNAQVVEELENSSLNGSLSSDSSNGANQSDENDKYASFVDDMTTNIVMKSTEGCTGMKRISSFQTEINELLRSDKVVVNEFEGMSNWWSNDHSTNPTNCWDGSSSIGFQNESNAHNYQDYD